MIAMSVFFRRRYMPLPVMALALALALALSLAAPAPALAHDFAEAPAGKCGKRASIQFDTSGTNAFTYPVDGPYGSASLKATDWLARDIGRDGMPRANSDGTLMAGDAIHAGYTYAIKHCKSPMRLADVRIDRAASFNTLSMPGVSSYNQWQWNIIEDTRLTIVEKDGSLRAGTMIKAEDAGRGKPDTYAGISVWLSDVEAMRCNNIKSQAVRDTLYTFGLHCESPREKEKKRDRGMALKHDLLKPFIAEKEWRFVWQHTASKPANSAYLHDMRGHGGIWDGGPYENETLVWTHPPRIIKEPHYTDDDIHDIDGDNNFDERTYHKEPLYTTASGLAKFSADVNDLPYHHRSHYSTGIALAGYMEISTDEMPIKGIRQHLHETACHKDSHRPCPDGTGGRGEPFVLDFNRTHAVWDWDDNLNGRTDINEKYTQDAKACLANAQVHTSLVDGRKYAYATVDGFTCDVKFDALDAGKEKEALADTLADALAGKSARCGAYVEWKKDKNGERDKASIIYQTCPLNELVRLYGYNADYPGHGLFLLKAEHAHTNPAYPYLTGTIYHDYVPPDDTRSVYFRHGYEPGSRGEITLEAEASCTYQIKSGESCKTQTFYKPVSWTMAHIIKPHYTLDVTHPWLPDMHGLPAKNMDGTYYINDPLAIKYEPDYAGTDLDASDRWNHIRFDTAIEDAPLSERTYLYQHDIEAAPIEIPSFNGSALGSADIARNITLSNGQGMLVYNFTHPSMSGQAHEWQLKQHAVNLGRPVKYTAEAEPSRFVAPYVPSFGSSAGYTYWPDGGHTEIDNRYAMLLDYRGGLYTDSHIYGHMPPGIDGVIPAPEALPVSAINPAESAAFDAFSEGLALGLAVPSYDVHTAAPPAQITYSWDEKKYPRGMYSAADYDIVVNQSAWDARLLGGAPIKGMSGGGSNLLYALDAYKEVWPDRPHKADDMRRDMWGRMSVHVPEPEYDRFRRAVANSWANNVTGYDLLGRAVFSGQYLYEHGVPYTYDKASLPLNDIYASSERGDYSGTMYRLDVAAAENITGTILASVFVDHMQQNTAAATDIYGRPVPALQQGIADDAQLFMANLSENDTRRWGPFDEPFNATINAERERQNVQYVHGNNTDNAIAWYTDGISKIILKHGPYRADRYDIGNLITLYTVNMAGHGSHASTQLAGAFYDDYDIDDENSRLDERRAGPSERKAGKYYYNMQQSRAETDAADKAEPPAGSAEKAELVYRTFMPAMRLHTSGESDTMMISGYHTWYSTYAAESVDATGEPAEPGMPFSLTVSPYVADTIVNETAIVDTADYPGAYLLADYLYDRTVAGILWMQGRHLDKDGDGEADSWWDFLKFDAEDNLDRVNDTAHAFAGALRADFERALYNASDPYLVLIERESGQPSGIDYSWQANSTAADTSTKPAIRVLQNTISNHTGVMHTGIYRTPISDETHVKDENGTYIHRYADARDRAAESRRQAVSAADGTSAGLPGPYEPVPAIMSVSDQLIRDYGHIGTLGSAWQAQQEDITGLTEPGRPHRHAKANELWQAEYDSSMWATQLLFNETAKRYRTMAIHGPFEMPMHRFLAASATDMNVRVDTAARTSIIDERLDGALNADYVFTFNVLHNNTIVPHVRHHHDGFIIRLTDFAGASAGDTIEYVRVFDHAGILLAEVKPDCPDAAVNLCEIFIKVPDTAAAHAANMTNMTIIAGGHYGGTYLAVDVPIRAATAPTVWQDEKQDQLITIALAAIASAVICWIIWRVLHKVAGVR